MIPTERKECRGYGRSRWARWRLVDSPVSTQNFNGESTTEEADVQGSFEGNLVVGKRLIVRATGRVSGKITYGEVEIERGGRICGEISHHGEGTVSSLKQAQVA